MDKTASLFKDRTCAKEISFLKRATDPEGQLGCYTEFW